LQTTPLSASKNESHKTRNSSLSDDFAPTPSLADRVKILVCVPSQIAKITIPKTKLALGCCGGAFEFAISEREVRWRGLLSLG
jgi:hypothetical protein